MAREAGKRSFGSGAGQLPGSMEVGCMVMSSRPIGYCFFVVGGLEGAQVQDGDWMA